MGQIYKAPEEFKIPEIDTDNIEGYWEACKKYQADIQAWARKNGSGPEAGEVVQFPVGDGAAVYVVFSLKPVKLIHIATGDAWDFPYVHRLTASDIRENIRQHKAMAKLFRRKK